MLVNPAVRMCISFELVIVKIQTGNYTDLPATFLAISVVRPISIYGYDACMFCTKAATCCSRATVPWELSSLS